MPRVLIVDDEENIRALLVATCATVEGIECIEAANPEEALVYFKSQHFDLVITDRSMPHPDMGERLVLDILEINHTVPIIMVTGDGISSPPSGVSCLVKKPFSVTVLLQTVKEAIAVCPVANLHSTDTPESPEEVASALDFGGGQADATTLAEGLPHHTNQPGNKTYWGYHAELVPSDAKTFARDHERYLARRALYDGDGAENSE